MSNIKENVIIYNKESTKQVYRDSKMKEHSCD